MSVLETFLRGHPPAEAVPSREPELRSLLYRVCTEIATLPFQLAYRFLHDFQTFSSSGYVKGVAVNGGACADKMLLLRAVLDWLQIRSKPILGGFGADRLISEDQLQAALNEEPDAERYPHMYHTAVLVDGGDYALLAEPSGGRVGCFVFDTPTTQSLLAQRLRLRCPNIAAPLYYHRFAAEITERIVENKLSNKQLIWTLIQRVGIAVAGHWTLYLKSFSNRAEYLEAMKQGSARQVYFTEREELGDHPFWALFDPSCTELFVEARLAVLKKQLVGPGDTITFRLDESQGDWGRGSTLEQAT